MDRTNDTKTFMTGSSKIRWDSMAGKSGSTTPATVQNHLQGNRALPFISEVECFHAVWNEILLESFKVH